PMISGNGARCAPSTGDTDDTAEPGLAAIMVTAAAVASKAAMGRDGMPATGASPNDGHATSQLPPGGHCLNGRALRAEPYRQSRLPAWYFRHVVPEQPGLEQPGDGLGRVTLGQRDERVRGDDAVPVGAGPVAQQCRESGVADGDAQRVHGERAA